MLAQGVTCGDVYASIDEAIAHTVKAIHGKTRPLCYDHSMLLALNADAARRAELGPFDGLLGFSQGANLATIVCAHLYALGNPADAGGKSGTRLAVDCGASADSGTRARPRVGRTALCAAVLRHTVWLGDAAAAPLWYKRHR